MNSEEYYQVRFESGLAKVGDSDDFLFHVLKGDNIYKTVVVKISRTFSESSYDHITENDLAMIAANAIKCYLLGEIPNGFVQEGTETIIRVQTGWYPNIHGEIGNNENYSDFIVNKPIRRIGFRTS